MHNSFDLRLSYFLSKRAALSHILPQFHLSCIELPKCIPTILMENCDQAICLGLSILFLYATACKVWLSEKLFLS